MFPFCKKNPYTDLIDKHFLNYSEQNSKQATGLVSRPTKLCMFLAKFYATMPNSIVCERLVTLISIHWYIVRTPSGNLMYIGTAKA